VGAAMDKSFSDPNEENVLIYEISDEDLETCDKGNSITLWVCTAQYFCPGP